MRLNPYTGSTLHSNAVPANRARPRRCRSSAGRRKYLAHGIGLAFLLLPADICRLWDSFAVCAASCLRSARMRPHTPWMRH
jgi:hypothetical protein